MAGQKLAPIFDATTNLAEKCIAQMGSFPEAEDKELWAYQKTMLFFFCKAYKTYQAIRLLCDSGFFEDSWVLTRTIFEIWLQAQWMSGRPGDRARLYTAHDPVMRYEFNKRLQALPDSSNTRRWLQSASSRPEQLKELKLRYDRDQHTFRRGKKTKKASVGGNENLSQTWWGHSIYWLAKRLGLEEQYTVLYWMQSALAHTAATSMKEYLREEGGDWKANCYPSTKSDFRFVVQFSTTWFVGIIQILNSAWSLPLDEGIQGVLGLLQHF